MGEEKIPEGAKVVPPKGSSSSNKTLIIILVVVGFLVVVPIIGFMALGAIFSNDKAAEKLTESIIERSTGSADVDIDSDNGGFTIKTEDGEVSAQAGQEKPESFPDSVPLFNKQEIVTSYSTKSESGEFWTIVAATNESVDSVQAYMRDALESAQWKSVSEATFNGISTNSYENGTLSLLLSISPPSDDNDNRTQVSYTVTQEAAE